MLFFFLFVFSKRLNSEVCRDSSGSKAPGLSLIPRAHLVEREPAPARCPDFYIPTVA